MVSKLEEEFDDFLLEEIINEHEKEIDALYEMRRVRPHHKYIDEWNNRIIDLEIEIKWQTGRFYRAQKNYRKYGS